MRILVFGGILLAPWSCWACSPGASAGFSNSGGQPNGTSGTVTTAASTTSSAVAAGGGGATSSGPGDGTPGSAGTVGGADPASTSGSTGAAGSDGDGTPSDGFEHPGLLLTAADIERMRTMVASGVEPYLSGYERLRAESRASLGHTPTPFEVVTRTTGAEGTGNTELRDDSNAAFFHAVLWVVSEDPAHAAKSIEILDAWSSTLVAIEGDADRFLAAGLYGYQLANAAELLRYTDSGWDEASIERFESMLLGLFYPLNREFLDTHAGSRVDHHFANWDASQMVTLLSIGVFADDRQKYGEAIDYFMNGEGNGNIKRLVFDGETGQLQESGRDQAHAQLGIGLMAAMCQTAFNQGDDLFAYDDNRLLKGFEYTAKYLLGYEVPFTTYMDESRTHTEISTDGRDQRRPIYEMIHNHYSVRRGVPAPFTEALASEIRPEGYHGDHPGFGTLLFTRTPE
jgi:hypothetical protein